MVTTAHAIRRSLVIRERAKVEGKGKRDWLHNDYPASRGLSLLHGFFEYEVVGVACHNHTPRAEVSLLHGF